MEKEYKKYYKDLFYRRVHRKGMKWKYFNLLIDVNKIIIKYYKAGLRLTIAELSKLINRSYRQTLRIVNELARAGFISIIRGRAGGVVSNSKILYEDFLRRQKIVTIGSLNNLTVTNDVKIDISKRDLLSKKQVFLSNSMEKIKNFHLITNLKTKEVSMHIEDTLFDRFCEIFNYEKDELERFLRQVLYWSSRLSITELQLETDITDFLTKCLQNHKKDVFLSDSGNVEEGYTIIQHKKVQGVYLYIKTNIINGWCGRYGYKESDLIDCLERYIYWRKNYSSMELRLRVELIGSVIDFINSDFILHGRKEELYGGCKYSPFQIRVGTSEEDKKWFGDWFKEKYGRRAREYFLLFYAKDKTKSRFFILPIGLRSWCYSLGLNRGDYGKIQNAIVNFVFEKMDFIPNVKENIFGLFVKFINYYLEKNDISPVVKKLTMASREASIKSKNNALRVNTINGFISVNRAEREKKIKEYNENISEIKSISQILTGSKTNWSWFMNEVKKDVTDMSDSEVLFERKKIKWHETISDLKDILGKNNLKDGDNFDDWYKKRLQNREIRKNDNRK